MNPYRPVAMPCSLLTKILSVNGLELTQIRLQVVEITDSPIGPEPGAEPLPDNGRGLALLRFRGHGGETLRTQHRVPPLKMPRTGHPRFRFGEEDQNP